jgi:uncharacterized membrane protein HdeD (DUF308 family)
MIQINADPETRQNLLTASTWSIVIGVLHVILGISAIALPLLFTFASTLLFGGLLTAWGIFQIIFAVQTRKQGILFIKVLIGILVLLGGLLILFNPIQGVLTLTLILGITFFVKGALQIFYAFKTRLSPTWVLLLLNGFLGIILGILIWSQWPTSAIWVIGLLVGIKFLFDGIAQILFSLSLRSALK